MNIDDITKKKDLAVFTFGRFNPPTRGHTAVFDKVKQLGGSDHYIFTGKTQDPNKNPLPKESKIKFLKSIYPGYNIMDDAQVRTPYEALKILGDKYKKLIMVVGDDRVKEFSNSMMKYQGTEFGPDELEVVSAGVRDPELEGTEGISASKARDFAKAGDYANFKNMVDGNDNIQQAMYDEIRKGMGVEESLTEETQGQPQVYLDMDGVLCDFFAEYAKLAGVKTGNYRDIPPAKVDPTLNKMVGTDFFNRLPKFGTTDSLVKMITERYGSYSICSSPLRGDHKNSAEWKRVWIKRELSPQPKDVIITGYKAKYAVQPDGTPNILIDDRGKNINEWKAKGGVGIKYQADENSLDIVKQGLDDYDNKVARMKNQQQLDMLSKVKDTDESINEDDHKYDDLDHKKKKIDPDLKLPNGKVMILQADDDKYIRGLGIKSNADGSYDSYYWYNDPKKKVPIEIKIDGKSVDKDAKNVHWAYHPELEEAIKEGVGKIVQGINTTVDVQVDQTRKEARKLSWYLDKQNKPPVLKTKAKMKNVYEEKEVPFKNQTGHMSLTTHPGTKKFQKMKKNSKPGTDDWFKTWRTLSYLTKGRKNHYMLPVKEAIEQMLLKYDMLKLKDDK